MFSGNRLVRTPKVSGSLVVDFDKPVTSTLWALARIDANASGSQYFRPANTAASRQGAFALVNLSAGVGFGDAFEIRGFAANLMDEKYLVDSQEVVPDLLAYTQRGEPRVVGIQVIARRR